MGLTGKVSVVFNSKGVKEDKAVTENEAEEVREEKVRKKVEKRKTRSLTRADKVKETPKNTKHEVEKNSTNVVNSSLVKDSNDKKVGSKRSLDNVLVDLLSKVEPVAKRRLPIASKNIRKPEVTIGSDDSFTETDNSFNEESSKLED